MLITIYTQAYSQKKPPNTKNPNQYLVKVALLFYFIYCMTNAKTFDDQLSMYIRWLVYRSSSLRKAESIENALITSC